MTLKIRQEVLMPEAIDGISQKFYEAGAATVKVKDQTVMVRRARLTLTSFVITVANAQDYGGSKLIDLPNRNILLLGCEVDCTVVKGGTTNGIVAATDLDMAIGTAVASNSTLSSTMVNIVEKKDIDTDALSVTFAGHSNDNASSLAPFKIADGANSALYMNLATGNITADDSVSVTGTVDLYYIDLGKED